MAVAVIEALLHSPLSCPLPSASSAYVLCQLYWGEFLGLCRHDPGRRLQFSNVNLLIIFLGQHSTSILHFLDCLLFLLNCLQSGHWFLGSTPSMTLYSNHPHPLHAGMPSASFRGRCRTRGTPGHSECMCWGGTRFTGTTKADTSTYFPSDPSHQDTSSRTEGMKTFKIHRESY